LIAVLKGGQAARTGRLADAADTLLRFADLLRPGEQRASLLDAIRRGELGRAIRVARAEGGDASWGALPWLWEAAGGPNDGWIVHVAQTIAPDVADAATRMDQGPSRTRVFTTPYAGLFALLPSLFDLGLADILQNAPYEGSSDINAPDALRLTLALKLLG